MKIYTKTGDKGTTSLVGGSRTEKSDIRVWCYGTIDETNSALGMARSHIADKEIRDIILKIQKTLFELGAELASVGTDNYKERIKEEDINFLENTIDKMESLKPDINGFIVPGGTEESSYLDIARTDARRAERYMTELISKYDISEKLLKYVNRLSDAIYSLARYIDYKDIFEKVHENIGNILGNTEKSNKNSKIEKLDRNLSEYITSHCIKKADEIEIPMVISIVDNGGNLIMLQRMDDSLLGSIEVSMGKAYTAAAFKMATNELKDMAVPEGELYGIGNLKKVITFGGGYPLKIGNKLVGAIGVSGGTAEQDMLVSKYGVEVFEEVVLNGIRK